MNFNQSIQHVEIQHPMAVALAVAIKLQLALAPWRHYLVPQWLRQSPFAVPRDPHAPGNQPA